MPAIHLGIDVAKKAFINLGELWLQTTWEILSKLELCKDNNKGNTNTVSSHSRNKSDIITSGSSRSNVDACSFASAVDGAPNPSFLDVSAKCLYVCARLWNRKCVMAWSTAETSHQLTEEDFTYLQYCKRY
jgi:hypothetical protein